MRLLRLGVLAGVAVCCLPSASLAQSSPCGIEGHTQIVGCLDSPQDGATVSRSAPIEIKGWVLNCETAQQPVEARVYVTPLVPHGWGHSRLLEKAEYDLHWRGERPEVTDVLSFFCPGVVKSNWGYLVVIKAGALLHEGDALIAVAFTDPPKFTGVNFQQIQVHVTP